MLSALLSHRLANRLAHGKQAKMLTAIPMRFYEKMTTEEYLLNTRQASMNTQM